MATNGDGEADDHQLSFARSYQIEALERAIKGNTIVFLETGSGKTLIAIMLLRRYAYLLRKPSPFIAVFLVPTVVLVNQQAECMRKHLDLKVEEYWGGKGVDYWDAADWTKQRDENQILVMTPDILRNALTHRFLTLDVIKVLVFDECHNAKKNHAYAIIMQDFYHCRLRDGDSQLPRILGMTASLVKAKGSSSTEEYWKQISTLENLLNSKVYTCKSESVLAEYIPFSTVKYKFYKDEEVPYQAFEELKNKLLILQKRHELAIESSSLSELSKESAMKRLSKLSSTFEFCLCELGVWLASEAAEAHSCEANDLFTWGTIKSRGEEIARDFCKDVHRIFSSSIPTGWLVNDNNQESVSLGLLSTKVVCLIESLAEYRHVDDMRCIIFVERVITAIVLKSLLCKLQPELFGWKTKYTASNHSGMQSQSRNAQNKIVDEFRKGTVNIIVATSILEEGLDVQSCNVVIRFDLSSTVTSFIQSRGRARMKNSDFLVLIRRDDPFIVFEYVEEQVQYVPPELVGGLGNDSTKFYYLYSIKLEKNFDYDIPLQDIVLGVNTELELDNQGLTFDLEVDRGSIVVSVTYIGTSLLTPEQVAISNQFQMTILRALVDHSIANLKSFEAIEMKNNLNVFDYILFPSPGLNVIDWISIRSVAFPYVKQHTCSLMGNDHHQIYTLNGLVCSCLVENALVYTPHNRRMYCTTRRLIGLNSNSSLKISQGEDITYKDYYKKRYDIDLRFGEESFFAARQLFVVRNNLQKGRHYKEKETSNARVELPSELCDIIMSPISVATFYAFSFVPSIMHRIESLLIALNLKKVHLDGIRPYGNVPAFKVLEAITTKGCQEKFDLESYETLGDSFLKYAASQQLFKTFQNQHEGILSSRKDKLISNDSLCRLGCHCNLPGFIRSEPFDPKTWVVPGDLSGSFHFEEVALSTQRKVYVGSKRKLKKKVVADAVEALIGLFLGEGGEPAALSLMNWLGIKVDLVNKPYIRELTLQPEKFINVEHLEERLLNYSFGDASLLVEALTHGSYMLPEIPRCYQRLEFLGDAVLDYLITIHLYNKYPGMSPGMLTDMRSASVNNECYALSAVKVDLHKHILHGSQDLHRHIVNTVYDFDRLTLESTFGWELETSFPKVLGDVIESLAGAILVDSGYNKEIVFKSIRPLVEPLVTPETLKLHPVRELDVICKKNHYERKTQIIGTEDGMLSCTIEVQLEGQSFKQSCMARDTKMAEKLASKHVLKLVKEKMFSSII